MKVTKSTIVLNKVRFYAYHGVDPQEQLTGAYFLVSIEAEVNNVNSTESDELTHTVSYADMLEVVRGVMDTPAQLLEYVAGAIGRHLLSGFPMVTQVVVEVIKENPPMSADCQGAGVRIVVEA